MTELLFENGGNNGLRGWKREQPGGKGNLFLKYVDFFCLLSQKTFIVGLLYAECVIT
jgi:hypothetical protein